MKQVSSAAAGFPRDVLARLACPYCGSRFELDAVVSENDQIRFGILHCSCHDYPVVEGIPILQQIDGIDGVVRLIADSDTRGALLRAFDIFRGPWARQSRLRRVRYRRNSARLVANSDVPFSEAIEMVRQPKTFADYLVHRYANPSFLAAIGPMLVLAEAATAPEVPAHGVSSKSHANRPARILDLGCGTGHASFVLKLLSPEATIVSVDQEFANVYLARRYMVPGGMQLCLDAQVPNPFPDGFFDAVYCQDAFHYIRSKKVAVDELKRVARRDAVWVFPHLHNRLCPNVVPGVPLSPDGYLQCFALPSARLFAESELLSRLSTDRLADLSELKPSAALADAPNLTLVSGNEDIWRVYRGFPDVFARSGSFLRLNPIYRVRSAGGSLLLDLRWPNPSMAQECAEAQAVLPATCRIEAAQLSQIESGWTGSTPEWLKELVAKFVLVPLPDHYRPEQQQ